MAKTKRGAIPKKAAKPKAEKKPKVRKVRATAAEKSDDQLRALLFSHKRKLVPLLRAEALAKADVTKAFEVAKKEGVAKRDIKLAIALDTEDGEEKARGEFQAIARVARWMGVPIGSQAELFPKFTQAEQDFEDGKRAALDDQPAKPPSHLSDKRVQTWLDGHAEGRTALNTQRASTGFKAIGDVASGVAGQMAEAEAATAGAAPHQQAA